MAASITELLKRLRRRTESRDRGAGQAIQEREQAEAQRRLLDQAARLRDAHRHGEPIASNGPKEPA
ncbi:hypothetical protein [Micromonospora sp. C41]|uniref:hypothetical protein n=1 Tax=Micromonospora sp. C41 TaxID=2824878 RepID=UPI001B35D6C3|nr:hypothetical protein [Micromonospora sp. C41]MBQ1063077.1 hypothetical protein [Micromonospora sp. C41]